MVRPQQLVESVLYVLQNEEELPANTSFVGYEPDIDSESIKLPLVEVSMGAQSEIDESNDDFVEYKKDSDGNYIGEVYETLYRQNINVFVWTAHGSKYSPRNISDYIRDALYKYNTVGPDKNLPHPEIGELTDVWRVKVTQGEHVDDLGTSPTLRRWQEIIQIHASERYVIDSDEPAIEGFTLQ